MNNKFANSKIYRISSSLGDLIYIGSTHGTLDNRFVRHAQDYFTYKRSGKCKVYSCEVFDAYGIANCRIELLHNYPCNSKFELSLEEGRVQLMNLKYLTNKNIAGRSVKQYYNDKRADILKQKKDYYKNNSDKRKAYQNNYNQRKRESKS